MILPIVQNNEAILRKKARKIEPNYPLSCLIMDMYMTMWENKGIGLAASQVNKCIRLFVIDTTKSHIEGIRETFINAHIIASSGEEDILEEGCLSLPGIRKEVSRKRMITVKYQNEKFEIQIKRFFGLEARVIQHELDHTKGKLITDYK